MLILYITYVILTPAPPIVGTPAEDVPGRFSTRTRGKAPFGTQQRWGRKARTEAVQEIRRWLRENRADICYIESPHADHVPLRYRLIRKIS